MSSNLKDSNTQCKVEELLEAERRVWPDMSDTNRHALESFGAILPREREREWLPLENELLKDDAYVEALFRQKCHVCNDLDPRGHIDSRIYRSGDVARTTLELRLNIWSARQQSSLQCGYCDLLNNVVKRFSLSISRLSQNQPLLLPPKLRSITMTEFEPTLLTLEALSASESRLFGLEIYKDIGEDIPSLPALGAANDILEQSDHNTSFAFIEECIKECCENHKLCNGPLPKLPRRVIDLSPTRGVKNTLRANVRMRETNGKEIARYAALSHCWGGDVSMKLESHNIDKMKDEIRFDDMPRTFQDAIVVARRLDISYIWIDSLCIIQQNQEDWAREAAKMGQIYCNAFLTIAAVSSQSGEIPFLRQQSAQFGSEKFRFWGPRREPLLSKAIKSIIPLRRNTTLKLDKHCALRTQLTTKMLVWR